MKSLVFITIFLSLFVGCKPDQVTNQYNHPKETVTETVVIPTTPKIIKSIGEFSFNKEISLPAYSKKLVFMNELITCEVSYGHSNFDRSLLITQKFNVESDFFYVHSKETEELTYVVHFSNNDSKLEKVDCRIQNAFSTFLNRDMIEAFQSVLQKSSIFASQNIEARY